MDDKKKKKFIIPSAEIVNFEKEDIITVSAGVNGWDDDNNVEDWEPTI